MTTTYARLLMGAALGAMAFMSSAAQAQQDQPQVDQAGLEPIIVTAQKRKESAQQVPIAISTFTAAAVENMGIKTTADLPLLVPGFTFAPAGGALNYYLRGVGTGTNNPGVESEVSTFVDGVYMPFQLNNLQAFNSIVSIEVDKGPQGTLFGRNATGGVIQITTKDPSFKTEFDAEVGYGNYDSVTSSLYVTSPISDKVAADVALHYYNQMDGFGKNLFNGKDIFKRKGFAARSKWLFNLSDATTVRITADYGESEGDDGSVVKPAVKNGTIFNIINGTNDFIPGFFNINSDNQPGWEGKQGGLSMKLDTDFGWARFVSITAWRKMRNEFHVDYDGTPIPFAPLLLIARDEAESQEFQLLSPDDSKLKWVIGTFLYNESGATDPFRFGGVLGQIISGQFGGPAVPISIVDFNKTRSYAVYGEATAKLASDTRLTLGLRYTIDQKKIRGQSLFDTSPVQTPVPGTQGNQTKNYYRPTWNVAFDHNFSPDFLAYASYRRGFHSGTFNSNNFGFSPEANPALDPEIIDAFEAGFKSEWLDRKLRINASAFYYKFKDLQLQLYEGGAVVTDNAAKADIKGVDVDITARPISSLTLSAGFEYLDAKYKDYPSATIYSLAPNGALVQSEGSASGRRLTKAPKISYNIVANHELSTGIGTFNTNVALFYNSGAYQDPGNFYKEPSYYVLNLSEKWTAPDGNVDVTIWAKNLTDTLYNYDVVLVEGVGPVGNAAPPRTYGVTLGFHF
ncbi:MAG TPA: TonB-dependent receptor [Novosphingobium sp.]|nr:TonB-dependent receptor [Novosphingobium sp.]